MEVLIKDEHCGSCIAVVNPINALRNKLNNIWQQLKSKLNDLELRSIPTETKLCLLICAISPDDSRIPIEDLVIYGKGLSLFKDMHDISEARCRVYNIIKIINDLKYPPKAIGSRIRLVHDIPQYPYMKMLVGAHDLARSIGSWYPLEFRRETIVEKWPKSNLYKNCFGLSLVLKKVKEHRVNLKCPKLTLLQLQYREDSQRIPVDFFEGMKKLCVLSLDVPSLPESLSVLRNLRTLRLKVLKFEDMSSIGCLVDLEFLSISVLGLTNIPMEVGQLENLRLLDMRETNIQYFPPDILSRLLKLEELYLPLSFDSWECKAKKYVDYYEWELREEDNDVDEERISAVTSQRDDEERINASLTEIISRSLHALQITVPKASLLPKNSVIFKNIQWFKILTPNNVRYQPFKEDLINELQLTGEASDIRESGICDLMGRTEDLCLTRVRNLKNVIDHLGDIGFPKLRKMIIVECDELEYVIDTTKLQSLSRGYCLFKKLECLHLSMISNLKEICHGRWTDFQWFPNLNQISIRFCHKLKYVFPLSIVEGLMLKSIEIHDCNEVEGVFCEDKEEGIPFKPCSIEKLELHSLPKMICFLVNGVHDGTNRSLTTLKTESNASRLNEHCIDNEDLVCLPPYSTSSEKRQRSVDEQLDSRKQVSIIKDSIRHVEIFFAFRSNLADNLLGDLKRLKIAFCDAVKVIFLFGENHATYNAFNSLKELELHGLPNLMHIWLCVPLEITTFQNLQLLVLSECNNLYLFSSQVAKLLVQLEKVFVCRCEKMKEIIGEEDEKAVEGIIVLPRLQLLELQRIPNLGAFSHGIYEIELPLLESLKFNQCKEVKYFCRGVPRTPRLQKIEINGGLCSLRGNLNGTIKRFKVLFDDLKTGTRGVRPGIVLGVGDFGVVYKGWIDEKTFAPSRFDTGMMVAVKRFRSEFQLGFKEYWSEVEFLEKLSHPNLTKLLGHYWVDKELYLVYEFMQSGSLDNHLFTSNTASESLSWDVRVKIAIEAARGLVFLHSKNIIHRDIKASNILLDDNYNAKISDYGLAISWWILDEYEYKDMEICGYAAPESFTGHLHAKSDVYGFGVVLLELMTGFRVQDESLSMPLVDMVHAFHRSSGRFGDMIDERLKDQWSQNAMLLAADLALNCVEDDASNRPSMTEVLAALEQIDAITDKPEESGTSEDSQPWKQAA